VELVEQDLLPALRQFSGRIRLAANQARPGGQHFGVLVEQLRASVVTLVAGHRGVGAAVVLKVKLADPALQPGAVLEALERAVKVLPGRFHTHLRTARDACGHATAAFDHVLGRAAAAVTVPVGDQDLVVDLLFLVAVIAAHDRRGCQVTVVGAEKRLARVGRILGGRDEVRQDGGSVNPLPPEGVGRDLVVLVPVDLRRHEVVDAGLFHDLGQGRAVTEDIRQPENAVLGAELLPEKPLAVQELAHQRLAGCQVAVGFDPHAPLGFPAAFGDPCPDPVKDLRVVLPQKLVELGLGGHEHVIRVLVHQLQDGGKAARRFLAGLVERPEPGHIDMGVADCAGQGLGFPAQLAVKGIGQESGRPGKRIRKRFRVGFAQIDQSDCLVQRRQDVQPVLVPLRQLGGHLAGNVQVIIKPFDRFVLGHQLQRQGRLFTD